MRIADHAATSLDSVAAPSNQTDTMPLCLIPWSLLPEEMFDICAVNVLGDTDYCLWPRTLRIAIMSVILELPFATSPAMSSLPNFRVLIAVP